MKYTTGQARRLAEALLKDEEGISEQAYEELLDFMEAFGLEDLRHQVDATDGRFYIESDEEFGCDDVSGHVQECIQAGTHLVGKDSDGSCTVCGHSITNLLVDDRVL